LVSHSIMKIVFQQLLAQGPVFTDMSGGLSKHFGEQVGH